jgi:hypothetical protein
MGWAHGSDLGWGRGPKLHGMQGVMLAWMAPLALDLSGVAAMTVEATGTQWSAELSGGPRRAARPTACLDRPRVEVVR